MCRWKGMRARRWVVVTVVGLMALTIAAGFGYEKANQPDPPVFCLASYWEPVVIGGYQYGLQDQGRPGPDQCDSGSYGSSSYIGNIIGFDCVVRGPDGREIMKVAPNRHFGMCGQPDGKDGRTLDDGTKLGEPSPDGTSADERIPAPWQDGRRAPPKGPNAAIVQQFRTAGAPNTCRPVGVDPSPMSATLGPHDGFAKVTTSRDGSPIDRRSLMRPYADVRIYRDDSMTGVRRSPSGRRTLVVYLPADDPGERCTYTYAIRPGDSVDHVRGSLRMVVG
jgi:hypothetical protein